MSNKNCGGSPIFNNQGTRIGQPNCTDCPSEFDCTDVLQAKCVSLTIPESCLSNVPDNMQEFVELVLDYICDQPATQELVWIDLTLNSGWIVLPGFQKPQYALDPTIIGKVHFRGSCSNEFFELHSNVVLNSQPFTLPTTIRPLAVRQNINGTFRFPNNPPGFDVTDFYVTRFTYHPNGEVRVEIRYEEILSDPRYTPPYIGNCRISLDGFSIETN